MMHFHGTPITPGPVLSALAGRSFCVSYAAPAQVARCHEIGQSVLLDNGAFSFWRIGKATDWMGYYEWAEQWLEYPTTWAVIPDVIDGTVEDNDDLIARWPPGFGFDNGAPVWHMHEPIERLERLCSIWPKVCVGSSGQFATVGDDLWRRRMDKAMNALCRYGVVPTWLHMLRGMSLAGSEYPFASVDSTDIAQNHHRGVDKLGKAIRWDALQCKPRWVHREQLEFAV